MATTRLCECQFHRHFAFITAGTIPPNPSELIYLITLQACGRVKTRLRFYSFDNPPIGLVTDAMHTFKMADYPIYVFKAGYSKRIFVQNLEYFGTNGSKIYHLF